MKLKFWGVRGSIPAPAPDTVAFGGNTSCVCADFGDDIVVFDAGTGIRLLGNSILAENRNPYVHLFLSHTHWDHIQGFPFFGPAYQPNFRMDVYGQGDANHTLGHILAGQMEGPNFPISLEQLGANIAYHDIQSGGIVGLGQKKTFAEVKATSGRHPNGVLAYRIEDSNSHQNFVYATDTEHYPNKIDSNLVELAKGCEVLIYDGMYTPQEYETKHQGWGHSTWEKGLELAIAAKVKTYVVFHHDPSHNDMFLANLERSVQAHAQKLNPSLKVLFAREGLIIDL